MVSPFTELVPEKGEVIGTVSANVEEVLEQAHCIVLWTCLDIDRYSYLRLPVKDLSYWAEHIGISA